jgi:hypothetical protein
MKNLVLAAAAASMAVTPAMAHPGHGNRHHRQHHVQRYTAPVVVYRPAPVYRYDQTYRGYSQYPYNYRYGQRYYGGHRYWRGNDGRYYCRRSDNTVGILVGAGLGALLGREFDRYGATGFIIGGTLGAILGREIMSGRVRCR